jgi:hypothetical protein
LHRVIIGAQQHVCRIDFIVLSTAMIAMPTPIFMPRNASL